METSGFKESTPVMISYNKGQCNERLAQAVWARVIAKRRLAREVGSERKKEKGLCQQPALLDWTRSRSGGSSTAAEAAATKLRFFARRTTKAIETIGVYHLITHLTDALD